MSRLIVNAIIEDSIASPGNDKDAYMIVSVQDSNGLPVENLTMSSFVVGSEVVGAGGSISHINMVRNGKLPGIYVLFLGPSAETTWKLGVYIWSVRVSNGTSQGTALCSCLMD
jgi:hypothetical protein